MTERTSCHRLQVATELYRFIEDRVLPGTGLESDAFWAGFDALVHDLAPKNAAWLAQRDPLPADNHAWPRAPPGPTRNHPQNRHFPHLRPLLPRPQSLPSVPFADESRPAFV